MNIQYSQLTDLTDLKDFIKSLPKDELGAYIAVTAGALLLLVSFILFIL